MHLKEIKTETHTYNVNEYECEQYVTVAPTDSHCSFDEYLIETMEEPEVGKTMVIKGRLIDHFTMTPSEEVTTLETTPVISISYD